MLILHIATGQAEKADRVCILAMMAEGEKFRSLHRSTKNSLAYSLEQMHAACIGESSSIASSTSDRSEIATGSISSSPASAFLKTAAPVFPSSKLTHHSSDSSLVAGTIKVPVIIHSWHEQRTAQLVANW